MHVQLKPETLEALLMHNRQIGRRGVMKKGAANGLRDFGTSCLRAPS